MASCGGFQVKGKKMKDERESSNSSWPNLPDDIIRLIMNRLVYVDQISFRAVCKGWRGADIEGVGSADKLPWMMAIDSHSCHLYDPFPKRKYTVETNTTELFTDTRVLASKYGWVLFAKFAKCNCLTSNSLFFYNPFTNKIIPLPDLTMKMNDKATFISTPDCSFSGCQVFVVKLYYNKVCINLWKTGDTTWIEFSFDLKGYKKTLDEKCILRMLGDVYCGNIEYFQGVVYCSLGNAVTGAFDVDQKQWEELPYPQKLIKLDSIYDYLIESDGNLFMVQHDISPCRHLVFRFDLSRMNWIEVRSLDNRSLFLGYTSLFVPAEEELSGLTNTIHSQKCYKCSRGDTPCQEISQIYDWNVPEFLRKFWIRPR